jgi:galactose mutarotase-like enzyme
MQIWKGEEVNTGDAVGVKMTLVSPDGDEGFPGMACPFLDSSQPIAHYLAAHCFCLKRVERVNASIAFPHAGKVTASITYTLNSKNELTLFYEATSDADTVCAYMSPNKF